MELSMWHVILLLMIVLLVFGAKRIPEIGSSLGQGIREFKKSIKEIDSGADQRSATPPPPAQNSTLPPSGGEPKRLSQ